MAPAKVAKVPETPSCAQTSDVWPAAETGPCRYCREACHRYGADATGVCHGCSQQAPRCNVCRTPLDPAVASYGVHPWCAEARGDTPWPGATS